MDLAGLDPFICSLCSHLRQRTSQSRSRPGARWPRCPHTWLGCWWTGGPRTCPWSPASTPPCTATCLYSPPPGHVASRSASDLRSSSRWNRETQSIRILEFMWRSNNFLLRGQLSSISSYHQSIEFEKSFFFQSVKNIILLYERPIWKGIIKKSYFQIINFLCIWRRKTLETFRLKPFGVQCSRILEHFYN